MNTSCTTLAFIDGLGGMEMLLIFVIVLLLFGGDKLPEFARGLGKTMREFKKAASGVEEEFRRAMEEDERKRNVVDATANAALPAATTPSEGATSSYPDDGYMGYGGESDSAPAATTATATEPAPVASPTAEPAPAEPAAATIPVESPEQKPTASAAPAVAPAPAAAPAPRPPVPNEDYP